MALGRLISLVVISGIFSKKDDDLNILPPPPPFPEIGKESGEVKGAERIREQKQREIELKGKDEERQRIKLEKRKAQEKEKLKPKEAKKKPFFGKIFGKKKEETEFAKELEEIEKIAPKPAKDERVKKAKLELPELISLKKEKFEKEIAKPEEVVKGDEEIKKAILGVKKAKRPSIVKGLFKKKKPVEEKVETPEVMPRTYDKIDHVEMIEEKIHKARLALMDFKFDDAKSVYIEIMKMYNELEPKKKSKVYQDIKDLYYERKSAEKFVK